MHRLGNRILLSCKSERAPFLACFFVFVFFLHFLVAYLCNLWVKVSEVQLPINIVKRKNKSFQIKVFLLVLINTTRKILVEIWTVTILALSIMEDLFNRSKHKRNLIKINSTAIHCSMHLTPMEEFVCGCVGITCSKGIY